jgi:hypothetical protein
MGMAVHEPRAKCVAGQIDHLHAWRRLEHLTDLADAAIDDQLLPWSRRIREPVPHNRAIDQSRRHSGHRTFRSRHEVVVRT